MTLRPQKNSAPEIVPAQDVEIADPAAYKVIYVYRLNDVRSHKGTLKVGDTSLKNAPETQNPSKKYPDNCTTLKDAADARIREQTATAGMHGHVEILYCTLGIDENGNAFRDYDVSAVLKNSGYKKIDFPHSNEWYRADLNSAIDAINAVKRGEKIIAKTATRWSPVVFRPEQETAIRQTVRAFGEKGQKSQFLWDAKMRFGKTLCALEVVKRLKIRKTIIATHRPAVKASWFEDFEKIFGNRGNEYRAGGGDSLQRRASLSDLEKSGKPFVYFASIQYLRRVVGLDNTKNSGSKNSVAVRQKIHGATAKEKTEAENVLETSWDLVIIDEAHEGMTTDYGAGVLNALRKSDARHPAKYLALSGTPFNIERTFAENEKFVWDYIREQQAKADWEKNHPGEPNPYASLPRMNILAYSLSETFRAERYVEVEDKCFKFSEFFRTRPENGKFVYEDDVKKFLDLLAGRSKNTTSYPFANEKFRNYFRHTFWVLPGVASAAALTKLLNRHSVFGSGAFKIVNVAGDGNQNPEEDDEASAAALDRVKNAIRNSARTITLSCGRLTTGVTVPEWTAVFYLSGGYKTSPASYMQTIFRVQSPGSVNGRAKEECYAFDFAPDRVLSIIEQVAQYAVGPQKSSREREEKVRHVIKQFTQYANVIAWDGSGMHRCDTRSILEQVRRLAITDVVRNGFCSRKIFNEKLWELDGADMSKFENLSKIIGRAPADSAPNDVPINAEGVNNEGDGVNDEGDGGTEDTSARPAPTKTRTKPNVSEEEKQRRKNRETAISILINATVRVPLLVFGAGAGGKNDEPETSINTDTFPDNFDDESWAEFMGKLTKEQFSGLVAPYLDKAVFEGACRRIRERVAAADTLPPLERIEKIVEIHSEFKNPEKETVLTPWRVVNMHLGSTLGGEIFFDETFQHDLLADAEKQGVAPKLRSLRLGNATTDTLANPDAKILEINSKTGLYPLYAAYSLMRAKLAADPRSPRRNESLEDAERRLWRETVEKNLFIICRTKMAQAIVRRTLLGFDKSARANIRVEENLIETVENLTPPVDNAKLSDKKKEELRIAPLKPYAQKLKTWKNFPALMEFDAIIGNPPYQNAEDIKNIIPIFNKFVDLSRAINPCYISLVIPSRWMKGGNRGLDAFLASMLDDIHLEVLHDFTQSQELFPNVDIKGGVCFFRWAREHNGKCRYTLHDSSNKTETTTRFLKTKGCPGFIRYATCISILEKIQKFNENSFSELVSFREPFGLKSDFFKNPGKYGCPKLSNTPISGGIEIYGWENSYRTTKYAPATYPIKRARSAIAKWKIFVPKAYGCGALGEVISTPILGTPILGTPMSACTETFLLVGPFEKEKHARNALAYLRTKTFRLLVGAKKHTQDATSEVYFFVPEQDFSKTWTDEKLFEKYGFTKEERAFIEKMVAPMPPPSTHSV